MAFSLGHWMRGLSAGKKSESLASTRESMALPYSELARRSRGAFGARSRVPSNFTQVQAVRAGTFRLTGAPPAEAVNCTPFSPFTRAHRVHGPFASETGTARVTAPSPSRPRIHT